MDVEDIVYMSPVILEEGTVCDRRLEVRLCVMRDQLRRRVFIIFSASRD